MKNTCVKSCKIIQMIRPVSIFFKLKIVEYTFSVRIGTRKSDK